MGLFRKVFGGSDSEHSQQARYDLGDSSAGSILLKGNGDFDFEVVGESHCQTALEEICGGRCEEGVNHECVAILVLDNANEYDSNAVAVFVQGERVGYLPRSSAKNYREAMAALNPLGRPVGCRALVRGGWDRGGGDLGHFGICLDVARPLQIHGND